MNASHAAMVTGVAVLLFAAIFMVGHYRREHRRAQMLRHMTSHGALAPAPSLRAHVAGRWSTQNEAPRSTSTSSDLSHNSRP